MVILSSTMLSAAAIARRVAARRSDRLSIFLFFIVLINTVMIKLNMLFLIPSCLYLTCLY